LTVYGFLSSGEKRVVEEHVIGKHVRLYLVLGILTGYDKLYFERISGAYCGIPVSSPDEHSVKMEPGLKEVYSNLGRLLTYTGRPDEALVYLDKALELDSNYVSALVNKGVALARMGMLREALEYFDRATRLEPNNEKAWYNEVLIHYMLGEREKALEEVLKALAINPNYELAKELREMLEKAFTNDT